MADKAKTQPYVGARPVPMKLFATWEVDRTPHDCIPRLCSLTLSRLIVLKPLGPDVSSISIAVKMQGSKRTLRSNEMVLPTNGLLETELQLHFSLQYPHFLKRVGNKLHVMLQRRKRYKNRTILGYKTLADGIINMSLVLQRQLDLELDLLNDGKESKGHNSVVAKVSVNSLNSQPVDFEGTTKSAHNTRDFSDEDEEFSSNDDGSDSEPMIEDRRVRGPGIIPSSARQRNLKQKFVSLLKRFRVNEDLHGLGADREVISSKLSGGEMDPADIEDLFKELELSDSGQEMDTMSISSTPKPSLRPFFSSSRSLFHETFSVPGRLVTHGHSLVDVPEPPLAERTIEKTSEESSKKADSDSHPDSDNPPPNGSPLKNPDEKDTENKKTRLFIRDSNTTNGKRKHSGERSGAGAGTCNTPAMAPGSTLSSLPVSLPSQSAPTEISEARKVVQETLTRILASDDFLPDHLFIVNTGDSLGPLVAAQLQEKNHKVVCTSNGADVKATVAFIVNKIQKFCNTSAKPPLVMKVVLAGSDSFLNLILRSYVDQLSNKPPDWQAYLRFLVVPLGTNTVSRYLGTLDSVYHAAFVGDTWKEAIEKADTNELLNRIQKYLQQASTTVNLPIAEAMLTYKEKSCNDESSQIFIPFMTDVRLGSEVISSASIEIDDTLSSNVSSSGSPPVTSCLDRKITPPSSPNVNTFVTVQSKEVSEPLELQIDYWILSTKTPENKLDGGNKNKVESLKSTLKCTFRSLQVLRLSGTGELPTPHFTVSYSTKEKKQKIMRLGKKKEKEKDNDPKNQTIDGVIRLICSTKTPSALLKLFIDGIEWSGVKFFQLSSQWQTHIRSFPVSLFVHNDTP